MKSESPVCAGMGKGLSGGSPRQTVQPSNVLEAGGGAPGYCNQTQRSGLVQFRVGRRARLDHVEQYQVRRAKTHLRQLLRRRVAFAEPLHDKALQLLLRQSEQSSGFLEVKIGLAGGQAELCSAHAEWFPGDRSSPSMWPF